MMGCRQQACSSHPPTHLGAVSCRYSWRHQLESLSDTYYVVAVDMKGYGDSDKPRVRGEGKEGALRMFRRALIGAR